MKAIFSRAANYGNAGKIGRFGGDAVVIGVVCVWVRCCWLVAGFCLSPVSWCSFVVPVVLSVLLRWWWYFAVCLVFLSWSRSVSVVAWVPWSSVRTVSACSLVVRRGFLVVRRTGLFFLGATDGRELLRHPHIFTVKCLAVSPAGLVASADASGTIQLLGFRVRSFDEYALGESARCCFFGVYV